MSLKLTIYCSPITHILVTTAAAEANNNGNKEANVRSKLNTSIANRIAAIGALKIAERDPAAAQTNNNFLVCAFI